MCGIFGIISPKNICFERSAQSMQDALIHRGPDGHGIIQHSVGINQIYLGHVRLAILDLSDNGLQPMESSCGRYNLTYNGEVYNYLEIKQELLREGYAFHTETDSEVVLYALIHWGEEAFNKFNGMWAIAFLDQNRKELLFSRDRFGVKPLYYAQDDDTVFFASEIKSILVGMNKKFKLNLKVTHRFLSQSILDYDTDTFFQGIHKVPQASYLKLDLNKTCLILKENFNFFWHYPTSHFQEEMSITEVITELDTLFTDAVKIRLRSDVPIGVTLSGGIDSSSIACKVSALMKGHPINTFSSISNEKAYDEQPFMDEVNQSLNSNAQKFNLSLHTKQLLQDYKNLAWFSDEPILSFSSVAFYYLMQLSCKSGVKVILSGQGADELLCGYKKYIYFYLKSLLSDKRALTFAYTFLSFLGNNTLIPEFNYHEAKRYLPAWLRSKKKSSLGANLLCFELDSLGMEKGGFLERQIQDMHSTSVPALLRYEDRLSMVSSVEVRLPFLDYRLVEFCLKLPTKLKLNRGWTKWIFRKAMDGQVPKNIIWRKDKQGFVSPQERWFKNELCNEITSLFNSDMVSAKLGLINIENLKSNYKLYCSGHRTISYKEVYNPFALEIWLRQFASYIEDVSN